MGKPCVAIVDSNTFACIGLKDMLQNVMPIMDVDTFRSFAELEANRPEHYFHYFVSVNVVLEHKAFFVSHKKRPLYCLISLSLPYCRKAFTIYA